jgi:hypothetical protein
LIGGGPHEEIRPIAASLLPIISRHKPLALISLQPVGSYATRPQRSDRSAQRASYRTATRFSRHSQLLPEHLDGETPATCALFARLSGEIRKLKTHWRSEQDSNRQSRPSDD